MMVYERMEMKKKAISFRKYYRELLTYRGKGGDLTELVRERKERAERRREDRKKLESILEFAKDNVIYECVGSSDDLNDCVFKVGVELTDCNCAKSASDIDKATHQIFSEVGVIPPDIWPYVPHPLCIANHLEENVFELEQIGALVETRVDFLLGFVKFSGNYYGKTASGNKYCTDIMIPTLRCVIYKDVPEWMTMYMGLEMPVVWFWGDEKRFKRPPFGHFSEPIGFNDFLLDLR